MPKKYLRRFPISWIVFFIGGFVLPLRPADSPGPYRIALVEGGKNRVAVIHGSGDEYAAGLIAAKLRTCSDQIAILNGGEPEKDPLPVKIFVGTLRSNRALADAVLRLGWKAEVESLPPEGYLLRTGPGLVILAGGDRTGAIYAAADLKNYYLIEEGNNLSVERLDHREIPKMAYRWFWNWDSRTNWDLADHDAVYEPTDKPLPPSESVRPWLKDPGAFLRNMKLVIDFMSEHKLNGLIIWGFLRDNHGGVEAAKQICEYANERGVRILPGVGLDRHYGGFYHEGNHEFNLETRARQFPGLRSMNRSGQFEPRTLNLEAPENRDWIRRGIRWLFRTFPIGGANLEFSEASAACNPEYIEARKRQPGNEPDFYKDLARVIPFAATEIKSAAPGAWISYATYAGFTPETSARPPLHVRLAPSGVLCQYTLTSMLEDLLHRPGEKTGSTRRDETSASWVTATPGLEEKAGSTWPDGLRPPGTSYIGYIHWNAFYTRQQYGFFVDAYRDAARRAFRHGFSGLDTYGEESPDFPNIELNYLSFSEFAYDPEMSDEAFLRKRVAPLYGGEAAGRLALEIARRVGPISAGEKPAGLDDLLDMAFRGRRLAAAHARFRWDRLIQFLQKIAD